MQVAHEMNYQIAQGNADGSKTIRNEQPVVAYPVDDHHQQHGKGQQHNQNDPILRGGRRG